jgi:hypothetical protein
LNTEDNNEPLSKYDFQIMLNETLSQIADGEADTADLPFYISEAETGENLGETTWDCNQCDPDECPFDCDYEEDEQ